MKIMILPCDCIGPEIMAATLEVVEAADARFGLGRSFTEEDAGFTSLRAHGTTLREDVRVGTHNQ